jgi:hypothetical protein
VAASRNADHGEADEGGDGSGVALEIAHLNGVHESDALQNEPILQIFSEQVPPVGTLRRSPQHRVPERQSVSSDGFKRRRKIAAVGRLYWEYTRRTLNLAAWKAILPLLRPQRCLFAARLCGLSASAWASSHTQPFDISRSVHRVDNFSGCST